MLFIPYGAPYLFPLVPHIFIFILLTSVELDQITMTSLIASSANTVFFVEAPRKLFVRHHPHLSPLLPVPLGTIFIYYVIFFQYSDRDFANYSLYICT